MKTIKTTHFGIQRKIVANMTSESWKNIPHVTYMYEPDVTEFFEEYKRLNAGRCRDEKITLNTLVLKVITEGLKKAPDMNAHIDYNGKLVRGKIETFEDINISMPTILPTGGMMTINLRNFENKSLDEMTDYIADVNRRISNTDLSEAMFGVSMSDTLKGLKKGKILQAFRRLIGSKTGSHRVKSMSIKERKEYEKIPACDRLTQSDLEQGTVTVSNIGSTYLGQRGATSLLEIVPPQVCAFAVGAIQDKPVVITKQSGEKVIEARKILPLCIAFDHRALDFGEIVPFMKQLDYIFENPEIIGTWTRGFSGNDEKLLHLA